MPPNDIPGGISASHPSSGQLPVLLAPTTTGKEKNKIRMELIPVACWKLNDVRFAFASSFVLPDSRAEFVDLSGLRKQHPGAPLSVFGHADPVGDDVFNKALSGHRAESIYAVLTRNVAMWEKLYSTAGSAEGWGSPAIQVMVNALGHATVTDFQKANGLTPDGAAGPLTRAKLFRAYMDFLCPDTLDKSEFLSGGADPKGKGDYQGCGEFNPAMVFSQSESAFFQKPANKEERDNENGVNRRVMVLLFRKDSQVAPDKWPCPRTSEGVEACHRRFWSDGDHRRSPQALRREFKTTKDTFACRFYHRLVIISPCEGILPVPSLDEVGPLLEQVTAPETAVTEESHGPEADRSNLVGSAAKPAAAPAPAPAPDPSAPAMVGPDFGFVMIRKDKSVARQLFRLRVDKPFDGKGTLTVNPADKIDFFAPGSGGVPMTFKGDNIFDGAALSSPNGVLVFAEGKVASVHKDDIKLTLTLSGGSKKLKGPATIKITSVELFLDIAEAPAPKTKLAPLPMPDKQTKGANVFIQSDPPAAHRAILIVGQPKPADLNHDLLLHTLSAKVEIFNEQIPAKGQKATSGVIKIKSSSIPAAGKQFFVEGRFLTKSPDEATFHIGIETGVLGTILNDHVAANVVEQNWKGQLFYNRVWNHDTGQPAPAVKEVLPNNKVELHGKIAGGAADNLIATTFLDDDGKFEFKTVPDFDTAFFRIFLEHKDSKVVHVKGKTMGGSSTPVNLPDFKIKAGKTVSFDHPIPPALFKGKIGAVDLGSVEVTHSRFIMYCDAYVSVVFGHKRLLELTGNTADAPLLIVNVPQNPKTETSDCGDEMRLLESDVQDRDVILHEYGHFIGQKFLGGFEFPGYEFNDEPAPASHYPGSTNPIAAEYYESAWDEGYATFISCALRDKPTYKDGHEPPDLTNPDPMQTLTDVHTKWGAHNEAPLQEALWSILKDAGVAFKDGFWKAFLAAPKPNHAYGFFDNWKAQGCPQVPKVIAAYKSRGMEFGYTYPEGADMFTAVAAPKTFDAAKKEFRTIDELFTNFGNVTGDASGTKLDYEMEFYNLNKLKNAGAMGAGSKAVLSKTKPVTVSFIIKLTPGKKYIVPRRFQIKP